MTSKRISWLDVAKGLLILSVLLHHIPHTAEVAGVDIYKYFDVYQFIIMPFFMPAFFVVTGWCTNFNKPFKAFLWSNIKGLLIPAFFLGAISNWVRLVADQCTVPIEYAKLGFRTLITEGGGYWFLSALFVAKVIYWVINRYSRYSLVTWSAVVLCLCAGINLYKGGVIFGITNTLL